MIFSEICEYLGSRLKVLAEINGFLLSIDASLYQKQKNRKSNFMMFFFFVFVFLFLFNVLVNNFSVMTRRSHLFLGGGGLYFLGVNVSNH